MARSQETFNKKQREKDRARKKKEKLEKREERKSDGSGIEIDWSKAPENLTMSETERNQQAENKKASN